MNQTEELKNSAVFKEWVKGKVVQIHNTYWDSKEPFFGFIVISQKELKHLTVEDFGFSDRAFNLYKEGKAPRFADSYRINRFWKSPNRKDQLEKIHVSVDHTDLTAEEVFSVLLKDYSCGLK